MPAAFREDVIGPEAWTRTKKSRRRLQTRSSISWELRSARRCRAGYTMRRSLIRRSTSCRALRKKLRNVLLTDTRIGDLKEFGRVVHAEMEALLSFARKGTSTKGATVYSTTFPCHNCAKHIIAAGISRVVFIEPYLKSRAFAFHEEAIEMGYPMLSQSELIDEQEDKKKVRFEPFFGVGPRRFFDLFSI